MGKVAVDKLRCRRRGPAAGFRRGGRNHHGWQGAMTGKRIRAPPWCQTPTQMPATQHRHRPQAGGSGGGLAFVILALLPSVSHE